MSNNGVFFLNLSILFISVTSPFNKFFGIIFCIILTKQKTPIVSKVKKTFVQKNAIISQPDNMKEINQRPKDLELTL